MTDRAVSIESCRNPAVVVTINTRVSEVDGGAVGVGETTLSSLPHAAARIAAATTSAFTR
jgi:hypothetical protein